MLTSMGHLSLSAIRRRLSQARATVLPFTEITGCSAMSNLAATSSIAAIAPEQVRSPINAKSLGGWKNYKELLRPAMEIITKKDKYKALKY